MEVRIVTDVTSEPIALSLVKDFCRIDADYTGEDATLTLLQISARELLEGFLNLSLAPKVIEIQYCGGYLQLPYGPHGDVVSVKYGDGTDIDEDNYRISGMQFKSIDTCVTSLSFFYPISGAYPIIEPMGSLQTSGVNIIINVGYVSDKLPGGLKLILLRLVDYMYQNRGSNVVEIPADIKHDAERYSHNSIL